MEASQQPLPRPSQPRDLETVEDGRQSREQLLRENQELREARECRVCRDQEVGTITLDTAATTDTAQVGVVFLPCGHLVTCTTCAASVTKCVVCRAQVTEAVRVYMA